jgi:hypothetical protein
MCLKPTYCSGRILVQHQIQIGRDFAIIARVREYSSWTLHISAFQLRFRYLKWESLSHLMIGLDNFGAKPITQNVDGVESAHNRMTIKPKCIFKTLSYSDIVICCLYNKEIEVHLTWLMFKVQCWTYIMCVKSNHFVQNVYKIIFLV